MIADAGRNRRPFAACRAPPAAFGLPNRDAHARISRPRSESDRWLTTTRAAANTDVPSRHRGQRESPQRVASLDIARGRRDDPHGDRPRARLLRGPPPAGRRPASSSRAGSRTSPRRPSCSSPARVRSSRAQARRQRARWRGILADARRVLVALELTVLRVAWTFNFDFAHYMLAGVIWMLGWCMMLMAALV